MRSKESVENAIQFLEREITKLKHLVSYHTQGRMEKEMIKDQIEIMEAHKGSLIWVLSDNSNYETRKDYLDFRNWVK
ncbi:hypothetical protein M9Y90_05405 [Leptospira interrogans]|uniref:hypothetical protein n=1 Tax=Leptospira interrogans TaxID=173 RepID=UPI001F4D0B8B|nr:hypothetical protein [Leptospira interrogans]MCL8310113.1 hypothetical protein [Leptospira interrogans]UNE66905.1 hypothetical protein FH588_20750 [Leptospira interrogans]